MSISSVSSASIVDQATTAANTGLTENDPTSSTKDTTQGAQAVKTQAQKDTVHLSAAAQAKALKQGGETPAQIAVALSTDIKTVDGYLGIQTTSTSSTAAPAVATPTPAAVTATTGTTTAATSPTQVSSQS